MATTDNRYQSGLEKIKRIYGKSWDVKFLDDISSDRIGRWTVEFLFGDVYDESKLDARSRQIAIIAALTTLGNANNNNTPLKIHINGALNVGCSRQEIIEIMGEMAAYAGFPAAVNGLSAAREVFKERDENRKKAK
jgi:4-carboxymuconolactone decarboxylase